MTRAFRIGALLAALLAATAGGKTKDEKIAEKYLKPSSSEKHSKSDKSSKSSSQPQPSGPPNKSEGYDGYKYVRGRNIFDPARRGMRLETSEASPTASTSPRGRTLALTGTMVTEGKSLAFFGGSAAEGSRVISMGSSVASYKVTAIAPTQVVLERDGKTLVLDVGRQVSFENPSGDGVSVNPVIETAVAPPTAESAGVPVVPGMAEDKTDILRRMMERRAKEVGK
jgi:hypothetical protein